MDWIDNFKTITDMASHYDLEPEELNELIHIGRKYHAEEGDNS